MLSNGQQTPRAIANTIGNFNVQGFCIAAVLWLISNNHLLHKLKTLAFRQIIKFANLEAAQAL